MGWAFDTRQAAVRAAFADAIQAMKERDTIRREIEGLRAANEVARTTIVRLSDIIGNDANTARKPEPDDPEKRNSTL